MVVEFFGFEFAHALAELMSFDRSLTLSVGLAQQAITAVDKERGVMAVAGIWAGCGRLHLRVSAQLASDLDEALGADITGKLGRILAQIRSLQTAIQVELAEHRFASVAPPRAHYFNDDDLFGS
ncbi:MAG TPA: hypothetical protein VII52_07520, partial [Gemmatimonadaceae bacterium]